MKGLFHFKTDGSVGNLAGKKLTLEQAQHLVDGYIETVAVIGQGKYKVGGQALLVNEEGMLLGLPANENATVRAGQRIVGDAVLIEWEKGDF